MGQLGTYSQVRLFLVALSAHVLRQHRESEEREAAGSKRARMGLHDATGNHVAVGWLLSEILHGLYQEASRRRGEASASDVSHSRGGSSHPNSCYRESGWCEF